MKVRRGKFSGKIGDEVYVNSKHGQVVRSRPRRTWHMTMGRARAQQNLVSAVGAWRKITRQQFEAWTAAGKKESLSAFALFCKINGVLATAGLPRVMDPPKREKLRPNPVGELEIRNRGGEIRLLLRVCRAPARHTFVLGSRWCRRGIWVRGNKYAILGLLPKAERGWSDITELYVKKFGKPPVGWRVFIRTRQMVNGWEDDFKETCADVPPPERQGS
jgi:hypothetical protein